MSKIKEMKALLARCTPEEKREVFDILRPDFRIHSLEEKLNVRAEVILEAIDRASDLTLRGIRGIIAEAFFGKEIVPRLKGWVNLPLEGDFSYDFLLQDTVGKVRVQVKMQHLKDHRPMLASEGYRRLPAGMYAVETQRTRGGINPQTKEDTRPYRFGEFDILAVSMHPSTNDWSRFMYTVCGWLLPRSEDDRLILKFQPVAKTPTETWTDDFATVVEWFRAGTNKKVL